MLELKNVSKYYNGASVSLGLRNISVKFNQNEIVAIVGESGAGKSTFLNVISFMDTYEAGEILFKGNETSYFNNHDMDLFRKNHIQYIPQNYNIIESYTVLENVMMPMLLENIDRKDAKEKALELIKRVGLLSRVNNKGSRLSGGEKQRCVIARALASNCEILACDEPTGNLDSETGQEIMKLIKEISKDKLVLIVTHNLSQVSSIATRVITLSDGEIKNDQVIKEVKQNIIEDTSTKMDENSIQPKILSNILYNHIKCTPHKLVISAFIALAFFLSTLVISLQCAKQYDLISYTDNPSYFNTMDNRLVVYQKDHQQLDTSIIDKINGEIYYNAFYEDIELRFSCLKSKNNIVAVYSKHKLNDLSITLGNLPQEDDDMFIVVPHEDASKFTNMFVNTLNEQISFESYFLDDVELKVCGVGYSDEISYPTLYTKIDLSEKISRMYLSDVTVTYEYNSTIYELDYRYTANGRSEVTPIRPKLEEIGDIVITIKGMYPVLLKDYDIRTENTADVEVQTLATNPDIPNTESDSQDEFEMAILISRDFKFDEIYEAVIYPKDMDKAIKTLKNAGYEVDTPGRFGIDYDSDEYMDFVIFLAVTVLSVLIVMLITNAIISKIIDTKAREYTILRSLGLLGNDTKKIILGETFIYLFIGFFLSFIIVAILNLFNVEALKILGYFNIIVAATYLFTFIFLLYKIYKKVYKKIIKKSITQTLSDEVLRK